MRFLSLGFVLLCLAGCSTVTSSGYGSVTREAQPPATASLFPADQAVMTDAEIGQILDTPWYVPATVRVAVVSLGHDSEFGSRRPSWLMGAQTVTSGDAVLHLQEIPIVHDASYLPSFLLPEKKTVPHLRGAAVRYRADWVLIYNSRVRSRFDGQFLAKDEVRGLCQVECALLDVRSGLITFTGTSTREFNVREKEEGEPLPLLVARAEMEAINEALAENIQGLGAVLENLE